MKFKQEPEPIYTLAAELPGVKVLNYVRYKGKVLTQALDLDGQLVGYKTGSKYFIAKSL